MTTSGFSHGSRHGVSLLLTTTLIMVLSACSARLPLRDAVWVDDTGRRNTVLVSYEIRLQTARWHPSDRDTRLDLHCHGGHDAKGGKTCLSLIVPFRGIDVVDGARVATFALDGASLYGLPYGDYTIGGAHYDVVVDQMERVSCHKDERGEFRCETRYVDDYDRFVVESPAPVSFIVDSGPGCHAGHLTLHVREQTVTRLSLEPGDRDSALSALPDTLQQAAKQHITEPC